MGNDYPVSAPFRILAYDTSMEAGPLNEEASNDKGEASEKVVCSQQNAHHS